VFTEGNWKCVKKGQKHSLFRAIKVFSQRREILISESE
jgi:hypothetical protein